MVKNIRKVQSLDISYVFLVLQSAKNARKKFYNLLKIDKELEMDGKKDEMQDITYKVDLSDL